MAPLTSCYFCGEAVGASLDEHAVPDTVPPDERVEVTLCATCAGKLQQLLAEVSGATVDSGEAGSSATGAAPDPASGEQSPIFAGDEGSVIDTDDDAEATSPAERPAEPTFEGDGEAQDSEDRQSPVASAATDGQTDESQEDDATADGSGATDAAAAAAEAAAAATDAAAATSDAAPSERTAESDTSARPAQQGSSASASRDGASETDATDADSTDGGSADSGAGGGVSTRTYNRVVRLLQNREFPVDRVEFETLATSAYDMDEQDCAAALDVAVQKGHLDERSGQLHRPD